MKKIYIVALLAISMTSCSKWLDITPNDTVVETALFKESQGFHNALNGIFRKMSDVKLYGREMTYGFTEVLSQNYCVETAQYSGINQWHQYFSAAKFDYTGNEDLKKCIDGIWTTAYQAIANCNNLIVNIEPTNNSIYKDGIHEKEMIKGEALAARAFIHFDILRLFGAAPITKDSKATIPYLTTFPYYGGQAPENTESILKKIEADLLEAKSMLMRYDTLDADRRKNLSNFRRFTLGAGINNSAFFNYRGYRMNCLAVTATLARVYNYWGKHDLAEQQAIIVEKFVSEYSRGEAVYALSYDKSSPVKNDRKLTKDLIFAIGHKKILDDYLTDYGTPSSNSFLLLNPALVIFDGGSSDKGDVRYKNLVEYSDWEVGYIPKKFLTFPETNTDGKEKEKETVDIMPIIRLSEMHMIMAEYYASQGDFTKAEEYLNTVRVGRNCAKAQLGITDMASFKRELFIEARKEFIQEGQIFFYYKKYNEPVTKQMNTALFVVPVPESEKVN